MSSVDKTNFIEVKNGGMKFHWRYGLNIQFAQNRYLKLRKNCAKESFSYSDNGLSLSIDLASKYQGVASTMMSAYTTAKQTLKKTIRPSGAGMATGRGGQANVKVRSYAPRQWVYR